MPLTREQRLDVTCALRWARKHGWQHAAYEHTWRNAGYWVTFDATDSSIVVDGRFDTAPVALRLARFTAQTPEQVLDVLAALGLLHPTLSPMVNRCIEETVEPASGQLDGCAEGFDGPASFTEAGQAFADLVNGGVSAGRAAEVLSTLARQGLIVSTEYADEIRSDLALDRDAFGGGDIAELAMVLTTGEYVPLDKDKP